MRKALVKHRLVTAGTAGRRTNLTQQEKDQELLLLAESALESNNLVPLVRALLCAGLVILNCISSNFRLAPGT